MKRLLFIAHRMPYPPDKGERVRAFHELQALSRHFRITLAALAHGDPDAGAAEELRACCEKIVTGRAGGRLGLLRGAFALCAGRSVTEGFFRDRGLLRTLLEEARRQPFDLVFAYSSSTLPYALAVPATARVMDLVDVDSVKWSAYADSAWWPKRWLYWREARTVAALERQAVKQCDAVLLVSEAEKRALGFSSPKVIALGNGVDIEYFNPVDRPAGPPSLAFTGTMDYRPNVDGVCWFVREVWPRLRQIVPELTFTIVGRDPTRAVRQLEQVAGVRVTGAVPDVRPYIAAATAAIAPLPMARGIQNKILEAMAMGKAIVGSPAAIEGLDVVIGKDLLQADSPDEWVRLVRTLLADGDLRQGLQRSARVCVESKYSWSARMAPLVSLCESLTAAAPPQAAERRARPACRSAPRIPAAESLEGGAQ